MQLIDKKHISSEMTDDAELASEALARSNADTLIAGKLNTISMEIQFDYANKNFYTEVLYDGNDKLTDVNIYVDATKVVQLFSKTFAYNINGRCNQIIITKLSDSSTLTKNITYKVSGYLETVTRVNSP